MTDIEKRARYAAINRLWMRTVVCCELHPDMLSLYKSSGLVVHSHPVEDPAHAAGCERTGIEQLEDSEANNPLAICIVTPLG